MIVKRLSLKKNFSWNFISNLIFAITQWGILSIIAKWGTITMVGQFSLGLAITAPIVLLTNIQLRAIQATDAKDSFDFGEYMGVRVITNVVGFVVILLVVLIGGYDIVTSLAIILIGFSKLIDGLSDVIYGYFQRHERMDYSSKSKIIKGILTFMLVAIVLKVSGNLIWALTLMCIAYLLSLVIYDLRILKKFRIIGISFQKGKVSDIVKLAYPLGIGIMLTSLYTNIPRFILEKYEGLMALGYFSAIAYILVAGNTFIGAVGQAVSPRLAKEFAIGNIKGFKRILMKSSMIGFIIGLFIFLIAFLVGDKVLVIIYTDEFADYQQIFILLSIASIITFTSSFLGYGITAMRSFKIQPFLALIWTVSSLILAMLLIPKFHIEGAVYTVIISSAIQFSIQLCYIIKKLNESSKIQL